METISNNQKDKQAEKACKYGCSKIIKWDLSQNAYIEVDTKQRHRCANWVPKKQQALNSFSHTISSEQLRYVDTVAPVLLEILSVVRNIEQLMQELNTETIEKKSEEQ